MKSFFRGGANHFSGQKAENKNLSATEADEKEIINTDPPSAGGNTLGAALLVPFASFGRIYSSSLEARPIFTKSVTAGVIFAFSDFLAQRIERKSRDTKLDWARLVSSGLVDLVYFGPAAHYWYGIIFRLLPGTSLGSALAKAFWGQVIFDPSFTCVFFAAGLLQYDDFTLRSWWSKIRLDLPEAWLAGMSFWPLMEFISFSILPIKWIPLFINLCSVVWTIYLSIVANRKTSITSDS